MTDQDEGTHPIAARYGTARGLARLALGHVQYYTGQAHLRPAPVEAVRRIVFVCQGNVCRSAFAEAEARARGLNAISFGLSTTKGHAADPRAVAVAHRMGVALDAHRATPRDDYTARAGDLLLAMEVRQLARIAADPALSALPRGLLGLAARPRRPHLHDPYGLSEAYMATCLSIIRDAVFNLSRAYPNAALSAQS